MSATSSRESARGRSLILKHRMYWLWFAWSRAERARRFKAAKANDWSSVPLRHRHGEGASQPTADLAGALKRPPRVQHFAYLKEKELPDFLRRLASYEGDRQTQLALKLTLLTMLRTNEVRLGRKDELERLDGSEPLWRIPEARMKQRREHLVPLSAQAVRCLKDAILLSGAVRCCFPAKEAMAS